MKLAISLISLVLFQNVNSQTFGIGGSIKTELNYFSSNNNSEQTLQKNSTKQLQLALGLYSFAKLSEHWFTDLAVSASRSNFQLNYKEGNAQFTQASIRNCEVDLGLSYIFNPNSRGIKLYAFAGPQLLFRRWGEETFINRVLDNAYWPDFRVQGQAGLGIRIPSGQQHFLQLFSGLRYSGRKQVIYDTPINQVYLGCNFGFAFKGSSRDRYKKCPTEF
ncbi:MAG: hypothetical protein ACKOXF_02445 [Chitinophagaceae bacterium]